MSISCIITQQDKVKVSHYKKTAADYILLYRRMIIYIRMQKKSHLTRDYESAFYCS